MSEEDVQDQSYLARLIKTRNDLAKEVDVVKSKRDAIASVAQAAGREILNDDEDREFREFVTKIKGLNAEIKAKDGLIGELDEENTERQALRAGAAIADRASSKLESINERATYTKDNRVSRSFFKDLAFIAMGRDVTGELRDRLRNHEQDVATLPEYSEYRASLNTTSGTGGTFTPPAYLLEQYIKFARPGRPFADAVANEALPDGTMQVNIPKINTGTAVAWQTTQNSAVTETDLTDAYVTANVNTIAGNQTVSRQLLERSGIPIDNLIFQDLAAAHAAYLDSAMFTGSGSGGQIQGINNVAGINTIALTGLTIQLVYAAVANAIQTVHTQRFAPPDCVLMAPRRWGWFLSLLDANDRPLFLPSANSPMNVGGVLERVASEAVVGQMHGLPVIVDASIPTILGAGSNQDPIYVLRSQDLCLFESGLRAEAFPQTLAQNMSVLLQVSSYAAFLSRYPASIVEITGATTPTWGS